MTHVTMERFYALQQAFEVSLSSHRTELKRDFDRKLDERCQEAQVATLRRAEAIMQPQFEGLEERFAEHIDKARRRDDEIEARLRKASEQLASSSEQLRSLHHRADSSSARTDELAGYANGATGRCEGLSRELQALGRELRAAIGEEKLEIVAVDEKLQGFVQDNAAVISAACQQVTDQFEVRSSCLSLETAETETRLLQRMEERSAQCLEEAKVHFKKTATSLSREIQDSRVKTQQRTDESQNDIEVLVRNTTSQLRDEFTRSSELAVASVSRRQDEANEAAAVALRDGLRGAADTAERVRSDAAFALTTAKGALESTLEKQAVDCAEAIAKLRQEALEAAEGNRKASKEAESRTFQTAVKEFERVAAQIEEKIRANQLDFEDTTAALKQDIRNCSSACQSELTSSMAQASAACSSEASANLAATEKQLRDEIAEALKAAKDHNTIAARGAADHLTQEVRACRASVEASDADRRASDAGLRKDISDTRRQLAAEDTSLGNRIEQVKGSLEVLIGQEMAKMPDGFVQVRRQLESEVGAIRSEIIRLPTKADVAEVSEKAAKEGRAVAETVEKHQVSMQALVAQISKQCGDVVSEVADTRHMTKKEVAVVGQELSSLKAAASSLGKGVVRTMQVLGFFECTDGQIQSFEVEDLLKWEQAGASLATAASNKWSPRWTKEKPTLLAALDRKAEAEAVVVLNTLVRECSPGAFQRLTAGMVQATEFEKKPAPPQKPPDPSAPPPPNLAKFRQDRTVVPSPPVGE